MASTILLRKMEKEVLPNEETNGQDPIKIVIMNRWVPNLIGLHGSLVKEIAKKCHGAKITYESNKEEEKAIKDCLAFIYGNLLSKQEAVCLILE